MHCNAFTALLQEKKIQKPYLYFYIYMFISIQIRHCDDYAIPFTKESNKTWLVLSSII